jgi:hypothetical protein
MVEAAMTATIKRFAPDYLAEVAEQSGRARGELELFRSYVTYVDLTKYNEDQIPTCVVTAPGTSETPARERGSRYMAPWGVGVGCVVSGQDAANTWELIGLYSAAVRAIVVQHKSLGGFASDTYWIGERYDELSSSDQRTIMAGVNQFSVWVEDVVDGAQGLLEPTPDATLPPGDWPLVATATATVTAKEN